MTHGSVKDVTDVRFTRVTTTHVALTLAGAVNVLKMYLQIMWKFQGQKSFPVSPQRYAEQLDAVAELLTEWGCVEEAIRGIEGATTTPSVDTVGANAVMIPLSVDVGPEEQA